MVLLFVLAQQVQRAKDTVAVIASKRRWGIRLREIKAGARAQCGAHGGSDDVLLHVMAELDLARRAPRDVALRTLLTPPFLNASHAACTVSDAVKESPRAPSEAK